MSVIPFGGMVAGSGGGGGGPTSLMVVDWMKRVRLARTRSSMSQQVCACGGAGLGGMLASPARLFGYLVRAMTRQNQQKESSPVEQNLNVVKNSTSYNTTLIDSLISIS